MTTETVRAEHEPEWVRRGREIAVAKAQEKAAPGSSAQPARPVPAELSKVRAAAGRAGGQAGRGTPKRGRGIPGFHGARLATWRRQRNLTQAALAGRSGQTRGAINRYEHGSRKPEKPALLGLIAALNSGIADTDPIVGIGDLVDMGELTREDPDMARQLAGEMLAQIPAAAAPRAIPGRHP
jgi:transcriptional regulator with XRE-family HTH domain